MPKTILVVEDENELTRVISDKLRHLGYVVKHAVTSEKAFAILSENNQISAVWLDHYLLGEESGIDLVKKMKLCSNGIEKIPVFVVTNTATEDKKMLYQEFGVSGYYIKAENKLEDIIASITSFLNNKQK